MNRALRRKQAKKQNKMTIRSKQILNPQTTGLSIVQLNQLQQLMQLANAAEKEERYPDAERFCRQALELFPNYSSPLAMLARLAYKFDKFDLAVEYMRKSLEILPDVPQRLSTYSNYLKRLDRQEEALEAVEKFLKLKPNSFHEMNNRAGILNILGRTEEALDVFEELVRKAPLYGKPFHNIAIQHKFKPGDRFSEYFEKLAKNIDKLKYDADLQDAHFALGNYYENLGDYKTGFSHFIEANKLMGKQIDYKVEDDLDYLKQIKKWFPEGGRWLSEGNSVSQSDGPIFIVGMPRSGTTLTEQILASHPEIYGAGELRYLGLVSIPFEKFHDEGELMPSDPKRFAEFKNFLEASASDLETKIMSKDPSAKHVVDKMPHNFLSLGYKHMMMPNAKIIHCKRNPVDTCLSMFRLQFEGKLYFTSDMRNLGKYYLGYLDLMEHWKKVLPDQILEVQYEDVVADMEGQARRIIDFVGVEWDDACLDFYKHKRSVHTASTNQVRQPIYNSSVGKYKKYGDLLNPLLEELAPALID